MTTSTDDRTDARRCAFCNAQNDPDDLNPIAGLAVCPRCASGDLDAAYAAHHFAEWHREYPTHSPGTGGWEYVVQTEVTRPTPLEIIVTFRAEKGSGSWFGRLFTRQDLQVGHEEFDKRIRIKTDLEYEPKVELLLKSEGVRAALMQLIGRRCTASIVGGLVGAGASLWNKEDVPPLADVRVHAMALAIHVERFARSMPF